MAYFVIIPDFVKNRESGRVGRHFGRIRHNLAMQLLIGQSGSYQNKKQVDRCRIARELVQLVKE